MFKPRARPIALLLLLLPLAACASSADPGGGGSRDLITREQITNANVSTAFEVVQRLRPQWLRSRGPGSVRGDLSLPLVYTDGVRFGGIDRLNDVNAMDIESIRFVSASDATTRYGTGHPGGVIAITTRR
ncbi:MAG: TonB-dependent receptor plug domain-containing protein [Longimicrobiales bacterium]